MCGLYLWLFYTGSLPTDWLKASCQRICVMQLLIQTDFFYTYSPVFYGPLCCFAIIFSKVTHYVRKLHGGINCKVDLSLRTFLVGVEGTLKWSSMYSSVDVTWTCMVTYSATIYSRVKGAWWVGVVTSCGLGGSGIESRWGRNFSHPSPDRPWDPPRLLYNGHRVSFPEVKRPGRGANHPPSPSAEFEERVELSCSPSGSSWPVIGRTLPFKSAWWVRITVCPGKILAIYALTIHLGVASI